MGEMLQRSNSVLWLIPSSTGIGSAVSADAAADDVVFVLEGGIMVLLIVVVVVVVVVCAVATRSDTVESDETAAAENPPLGMRGGVSRLSVLGAALDAAGLDGVADRSDSSADV